MSIGRYIVAFAVACAAAGCAMDDVVMDLDSTSTSSMEGGGTQFGATIDGVMWYWNVSWSDVKDTPDWDPGQEPAISMPKAIELAQAEMSKYADSPDAYELDGVEWSPISQCCRPSARKWIYVVNFERKDRFPSGARGTIRIPVLLDGRAIEGKKELPR
jgi:hypothetical protein